MKRSKAKHIPGCVADANGLDPDCPCSRRKPRTKAKRVEAWAAVFADTGSQCEQDSVFFEKESAAYVAKLFSGFAYGSRVAHLVEADPLARLKEIVLKAARRNAAHLGTGSAALEIRAAVERLERKR